MKKFLELWWPWIVTCLLMIFVTIIFLIASKYNKEMTNLCEKDGKVAIEDRRGNFYCVDGKKVPLEVNGK